MKHPTPAGAIGTTVRHEAPEGATAASPRLYFVLVDFGPRLGEAWVERDPVDMTWQKTVRDIATGEWHGRVVRVLEIDRGQGTCRDVTQRALESC